MSSRSLHQIVKATSGQDVYLCRECQLCDNVSAIDMDVPLKMVLKMIMFDDEEVLTSRTVWSDRVFDAAARACKRGINLQAILLALRSENRLRETGSE